MTSACAADSPSTSEDCEAAIRIGNTVYLAYSTTATDPSERFRMAEEPSCADVGQNSSGSFFDENPPRVQTWSFTNHDPDEVVGVRLGDSWRLYFSEAVDRNERDAIATDLGG
jgi:hypothetical protein